VAGHRSRVTTPDRAALARRVAAAAARAEQRLAGLLADLGERSLGAYAGHLDAAERRLQSGVARSPDVIVRRFRVGGDDGWPALAVFVQGLADTQQVDQDLLAPASRAPADLIARRPSAGAQALARAIAVGHASTARRWHDLIRKLMAGNTLLFLEGCPRVLVLDTVKYPARSIDRPETERTVRGNQEAFNEVLLTQMNQMRRLVASHRLVFEPVSLGRLSATQLAVTYLDGITNPALVDAVKERLDRVQLEAVVTQAMALAALRDQTLTIFPQVRTTERVDFAAREVVNGKVAILFENIPFPALVPATFLDFFRTSQDYNYSFWEATLTRMVRFLGFAIGLYAPALYVALTSVDPDLMPSKLLLSAAGAFQAVPFPPVVEVLFMFGIIELLREAAIRLPKPMSQTLGTVGAIVIGTSIVSAGVVSTQMIVLVTLTAVGVFTAPTWEITVVMRWLIWPMVLGAYVMGVYGIVLVTLLLVQHMAGLSSFGVPYLTPFGPWRPSEMVDAWARAPAFALRRRPQSLFTLDPDKRTRTAVASGDVPLERSSRRRRRT
jgi:hypothetical protein